MNNSNHDYSSSSGGSTSTAVWTVGWGFSARCDLKCAFCYSAEVRSSLTNREVSLKEAREFLALNGKHIQAINFGTGECFLSPNFLHLLRLCKEYAPQAKVAVTTNGAFASIPSSMFPAVGQYIQECDVSIDFAKPDQHDRWRGKAGTWQRAMKAVEIALNSGLRTSMVMIGTAQTLSRKNIEGLMKIATGFQIAIRINLYMPTSGNYSFAPSFHSVFVALTLFKKWSSAVRSSDRLIGAIIGNSQPDSRLKMRHSCRILPDGSISPSTYLLEPPWLIQNGIPKTEIAELKHTDPFVRYSNPPTPRACASCSLLSECLGGSVERRWLWAHSLEAVDPLCPMQNRNGRYTTTLLLSNNKNYGVWPGPTIHLDYLPTIVAVPPGVR